MNQTRTITTKHFPALIYRVEGAGPALMLLHGFPASGVLWDGVASALAEHFTLLIPDLPGAGGSKLAKESASMEELATVIPAVLDDAGIDKCVVAGHSMGGYIALACAEKFPQRFAGLSLVHSSALADDEARKEKRSKSAAFVQKGGKDAFIRSMIPTLFSDEMRHDEPDVIERWIREGLQLPAASIIAYQNAMMARPDRQDVIRHAGFPVQWIAGKDDTLAAPSAVLPQCTLSHVSFVSVYERCAHMSMIEQPLKLIEDLTAFAGCCHNVRILEEVTV